MNLSRLVKRMVAVADDITSNGGLQVAVDHWPATRGVRGPSYPAEATTLSALVEEEQARWPQADGTLRLSKAKLTFLVPLAVTSDDLFTVTLPTGAAVKWPVASFKGMHDEDGAHYVTEVWLG